MKIEITYSRLFEKQIEKVPSYIKRKVYLWVFAVEVKGIDEMMRVKRYRDESLKGKRKGQRSIRLSKGYRLIYEVIEKHVHIQICEVNKHEY